MNRPKALVIGDPMVDIYHYGKATRISPEAPVVVFKKSHTVYALGGALNLGANLASFCDVDFGSSVYACRGMNLPENFLKNSEDVLIKKHRFIDIDYNIPCGLRFDEELVYKELDLNKNLFLVKNYDFIVISDYNKGTISDECLVTLFKEISRLGVSERPIIFLDTKKDYFGDYEDFFHMIDYFKPNKVEFDKYKNWLEEKSIPIKEGFQNIFVTKSKDGIDFYETGLNPNVSNYIPSFCKKLVDVTGAGDSAMAGLIYGLIQSRKKLENTYLMMMEYANAFAKLACENKGTFVVTESHLPEIEKAVSDYYARR